MTGKELSEKLNLLLGEKLTISINDVILSGTLKTYEESHRQSLYKMGNAIFLYFTKTYMNLNIYKKDFIF